MSEVMQLSPLWRRSNPQKINQAVVVISGSDLLRKALHGEKAEKQGQQTGTG